VLCKGRGDEIPEPDCLAALFGSGARCRSIWLLLVMSSTNNVGAAYPIVGISSQHLLMLLLAYSEAVNLSCCIDTTMFLWGYSVLVRVVLLY